MNSYREFVEDFGDYEGITEQEFFDYLRIIPSTEYYQLDMFLQIHICRQILNKFERPNFKI